MPDGHIDPVPELPCTRCGEAVARLATILDVKETRHAHLYECRACGNWMWTHTLIKRRALGGKNFS